MDLKIMDFLIISVGLILSWILIQFFFQITNARKSKNLPPGPRALPIIGNLHKLGSKPHKSLAELAKIHGPIMSLKLGSNYTIVISSSSAAKEALHKHDLAFSGRHIPDAITAHNHSQLSVVWLPVAAKWRSLRKSMITNFFSTISLDAAIHLRSKKVKELVEFCRESSCRMKAVDIGGAGFRTSLNLLSNTIFSIDLIDPHSESDLAKEFKQVVVDILVEAGKPNLADFFPILKKIDPQGIRKRTTLLYGKIFHLLDELIDRRMESRKLTNDSRNNDSLDLFLNSICQENPEHQQIDRLQIRHLFLDLIIGGTDTTSSTLEWAMAELLRNPEIMTKAKAELEKVIGKGKMVEEAFVSKLPYLQCIVKETLRIHTPAPLLPRKVESDVEVDGYVVPKNSHVFVNLWAIGRDPSVWEDPLSFKPERFFNSKVDVRGQHFELIPFGVGRRICPGLSLPMMMIPMMLGSLINSFYWEIEGGIEPKELDMDERFGLTLLKAQPLLAVPIPLMVD